MKVRPWLLLLLLVAIAAGAFFLFLLRRVEREDLRQLQDDLANTARSVAERVAEPLSNESNLDQVRKLAQTTRDATRSRVRVLSSRLQVVADSFGDTKAQDYLRARPEIEQALQGDSAAYTRFSDETERSLALFVAEPVRFKGRIVGLVYVSRSTDSILYKLGVLRRYSRDWLMIFTGLTFVGALYLSGNLRFTLSRLRLLTSDLDQKPVQVTVPGHDEVARIGENFNRLVSSLQQKIRELEEERDKTRRFVEDIAHELKTPITGLTGSVEVLEGQDWQDETALRRLLGNVKKETDRLAQLASRLLDLQKLDYYRLQPERFELVSLLETVIDTFTAEAAKKGMEIHLQAPEEVLVRADPAKILQVAGNLLDNAIRCSPSDAALDLRVSLDDASVSVVVADRGPGISEQDRERIFQRHQRGPAERAESPMGSLGLGLSIAWEIMRKHDQEIGARPRQGGGSEFFFKLPLSPD